MNTSKSFSLAFFVILFLSNMTAMAQKPVKVGGEEMLPSKNMVENLSKSKAHKKLVAAIKAAGLEETLSVKDMMTVFAPTDFAFSELPNGTLENLSKPEYKQALTDVLTYHVFSGKLTSVSLRAQIAENNGRVSLKTLNGKMIKFYIEDDDIYLADQSGKSAAVTISDANSSNGVIHVIDAVLMPK